MDISHFTRHTSARLPDRDISQLTCQPGCQIRIFLTLHDTAAWLPYKDISHLTCQPGCQIKNISHLTHQPVCHIRSFHTLHGCHVRTYPTLSHSPAAMIPGNVSLLAKCRLKKGRQMVRCPSVVLTENVFTHHLIKRMLLFFDHCIIYCPKLSS